MDAPLNATGRTIVAANPVSATVASFVDTDPTDTPADPATDPSDYTATIAWGDGNTSAGTIVSNGVPHQFDVTGTHNYTAADLGPQTLSIHICDVGGACADATSNLTVFQFLDGRRRLRDRRPERGAGRTGDVLGCAVGEGQLAQRRWCEQQLQGLRRDVESRRVCGGTFTAGPGNSASFSGQLPTYMGVLVSSSITKHGSSIGGNVVHIVVVKTNAGYPSNPGHAGTGTEVTVFC